MCDMDKKNKCESNQKKEDLLGIIKEKEVKIAEGKNSISSEDIQMQKLKSELEEYRNPLIKCMEQEYKKHKKYDFELYRKFKEKCESYEIEQLLYVKASLELKKKANADYSGNASFYTVIISNIIMVLTMWYGILGNSGILSQTPTKSNILNQAICFGLFYLALNLILKILYSCANRYYTKYIFFYDIVCDIIEEKIRKEN